MAQLSPEVPSIYDFLGYIGFIIVALFFFLSGYGIMAGYIEKTNYLAGFLKRHLLGILIPYWIWFLMVGVINYCLEGTMYSRAEILKLFVGCYGCWFVTAIIWFYISFWISFKFFKKYYAISLVVCVILYTVVCMRLGYHSSWTASSSAFIFGILWRKYKTVIDNYLRNNYYLKMSISFGLFVFVFVGRLVLVYIGVNPLIMQCIMRNIASCLFVLVLMLFMQKIKLKKSMLHYVGDYSLELYMVHVALLGFLKYGVLPFVLITLIGTVLLKLISQRIIKCICIRSFDRRSEPAANH